MSRNSDFGTFGRYTELQLDEMTADQRKAYEFTVGRRGEVPGPYSATSRSAFRNEARIVNSATTKTSLRNFRPRSHSFA
jgi:hypothetical protein